MNLQAANFNSVIPSEVEGPRGASLPVTPRDSSTPLRSARNDNKANRVFAHFRW